MLSEDLLDLSAKCKLLQSDVVGIKSEESGKSSRKSLEPITRLRKNTEELRKVEETDPNVQFVLDKLKDIIGE